eukprot:1310381-Rhodomonas_salina.2
MMTHAKLYNTAVVGFDMPSHGRSDGLHIYVEGDKMKKSGNARLILLLVGSNSCGRWRCRLV